MQLSKSVNYAGTAVDGTATSDARAVVGLAIPYSSRSLRLAPKEKICFA
jgi:hypothetical protein